MASTLERVEEEPQPQTSGYLQQMSPPVRRQPPPRRQLSRAQSVKEYIRRNTKKFFGVGDEADPNIWAGRRKRLCNRRWGQLKDEYLHQESIEDVLDGHHDPYARPRVVSQIESEDTGTSAAYTGIPHSSVSSRPRTYARQSSHKDSVAKMTWDGLTSLLRGKKQLKGSRKRPKLNSRSFGPASVTDSVFESEPESIVGAAGPPMHPALVIEQDSIVDDVFYDIKTPSDVPQHLYLKRLKAEQQITAAEDISDSSRETQPLGMRRIWNRLVDRAFDNSDRHKYGEGIFRKCCRRRCQRDQTLGKEQLNDIDDHRPYFTYWVTIAQILITIISLSVYGFAPVGFEMTQKSAMVMEINLALKQVDYFEPENFWLGPRSTDLIHLGAKYTPCMRKDKKIFEFIQAERMKENNSACCIRNDNSGCVQTLQEDCSAMISTWKRWSVNSSGPDNRLSGTVCGQDPRYCTEPASVKPFQWPDDITLWPICRRKIKTDLSKAAEEHMSCEIIGSPCCVGVEGECQITTLEYCNFVKGYFHEEATLCSQVSCMNHICGMISFYNPDVPDQFYRLWTSLFLHAGIVHCAVTVLIQYFIMRDIEKLAGWLRIAIIYIVSGIGGNLASATFLPYRAEVGPAGSQFGLLACLFVEIFHSWKILKRPFLAILRLSGIVIFLFIIGFLPWIDNYAHLFGFIFGLLLSFALLPFVSFGTFDRRRKILTIAVCLTLVVGLFTTLIIIFYVHPFYDCEHCYLFNCIPFTDKFCRNHEFKVHRRPK